MIEVCTDELIRLRNVPDVLRNIVMGRKIHSSTVHRWASKGVRGIVLETVSVGGIKYTTKEAIRRFSKACSAPSVTVKPSPTKTRMKQISRAEHSLDEAGI